MRAVDRKRLQYVGQEHSAARGGAEYGTGMGRGASVLRAVASVAAAHRRVDSRERFVGGQQIAVLCGDQPAAGYRGPGTRWAADVVLARRVVERNELARPPH